MAMLLVYFVEHLQAEQRSPATLTQPCDDSATATRLAPATRRRLPPNMDAWLGWSTTLNETATAAELCTFLRVPPLTRPPAALQPDCRLWSQADLRRLRGATHYSGLLPLLQRLDAGLPITVAAFGSSITSNFGGCFHADIAFLRSRVENLPSNFLGNVARTMCAPDSAWRVGFASLFMAAVNRTWPHQQHLLLNIGMGATTLSSVVDHTCLDEHTPPDVDLLLFEQYQEEREPQKLGKRNGVEAERLYRQLQARRDAFLAANTTNNENDSKIAMRAPGVPIPLFLLNFMEVVGGPAETCLSNWGKECGGPLLACSRNFTHRVSPVHSVLREEHLDVMAHYYGWSSFSVRTMVAGALRDGLHTASGMSECQFLGYLFYDHIHCTALLAWMLADAMVQHLVDAAVWADAAADAGVAPTALHLPAEPLFPGATAAMQNRECAPAAQLAVSAARHWTFHETEEVATHISAVAPESHTAAARNAAAMHTVHKPGWISEAADAELDIDLMAVTGVGAAAVRGATITVTIVYLKSYVNMTVVTLSCAGCACPTASLDSRCEEQVSLHASHMLRVDLRPQEHDNHSATCQLQLRVNATAANGASKFKVLGLVVGE